MFQHDAFISYAHIDNQPLVGADRGWVSQFDATLRTLVNQFMGEEVRVWRDEKLAGNDVFDAEIMQRLSGAAILVSVLSPRYQRSDYCCKELTRFCEEAARTGGLTVGNKSRVFKVVKTPIDPDPPLPEPVRATLGFPFFSEQAGGVPQPLDPDYGPQARQEYLVRLNSLAFEVARTIKEMRALARTSNGSGATEAEAAAARAALAAVAAAMPQATVYLAECGHDLRDARARLAAVLRREGHRVLEAGVQAWTDADLQAAVDTALAECVYAVHLVGAGVGPVPDGSTGRSQAMIENERAAHRCRAGGLRRVIWVPEGVAGQRPEQQAFIDAVLRDPAAQAGADVRRDSIEALKSAVLEALKPKPKPTQPPSPGSGAAWAGAGGPDAPRHTVFVVLTEADLDVARPLLAALTGRDIDWTVPEFKGDAAALRERNGRLLAAADAVVLLYGNGDGLWRQYQTTDLRKQLALSGRRIPLLTCLSPPLTDDKAVRRQVGGAQQIDALDGFGTDVPSALLSALGIAP